MAEDVAYKRFSGKDFASDDLKKEDRLEDQYMSVIRAILNGLTLLPETESMRRKAEVVVQVFKDFQFSTNDGFEARKTLNMAQEWMGSAKYDLAGLGIHDWVTKARQQAGKVLALIQQRVDNESAKVKGELADARKAFDIVNAMAVLQPSDGLTQLIQTLFGIKERAKQYYISSGKSTSDSDDSEDGGEDGKDGGGVPPPPYSLSETGLAVREGGIADKSQCSTLRGCFHIDRQQRFPLRKPLITDKHRLPALCEPLTNDK